MPELIHMPWLLALGLVAGMLGAMAGLGGSLFVLPGLALILGYATEAHSEQHLYTAAAMCVNFAVAVPATIRHARAGAVHADLLKSVLPGQIVGIVTGVFVGNRLSGLMIGRWLAILIVVMVVIGLVRDVLVKQAQSHEGEHPGPHPIAVFMVSLAAGVIAGLLGLGGGVILVPALQVLARVDLRRAIATSSAVICVSSVIGSGTKLWSLTTPTLAEHGLTIAHALGIAGVVGAGGVVGAWIGASLTHRVSRNVLKWIVAGILIVAAGYMWHTSTKPASTTVTPPIHGSVPS
ncbi:MAG: sulfite exporter TauE/SafE family protein [Phycisphaerales bacterium]|nr:MAG: sulfite exporter TauE/SafE family protein [Phycisphaerales bacterium]